MIKDHGNIILNNKNYYYKINDSYMEILTEKIEELFNLNHAHYIPFNVDGFNYYLSEDLNNLGTFQTVEEYGITTNYFYEIIMLVDNLFHNNRINNDIYKMFFMDLIIMNIDRSFNNWGFLNNDNNTSLYLLDNNMSFYDTKSYISTMLNNYSMDSLKEISNIFECFSKEHISLFNDMFNTLDYKTLEYFISKTEKEINMAFPNKKEHLLLFQSHRENIQDIKNRN